MTNQTRFKLALGMLGLYMAEGVLKSLLPGFPIELIVGAQGFIAAYYFTVKSVTDVNQLKTTAKNPVV